MMRCVNEGERPTSSAVPPMVDARPGVARSDGSTHSDVVTRLRDQIERSIAGGTVAGGSPVTAPTSVDGAASSCCPTTADESTRARSARIRVGDTVTGTCSCGTVFSFVFRGGGMRRRCDACRAKATTRSVAPTRLVVDDHGTIVRLKRCNGCLGWFDHKDGYTVKVRDRRTGLPMSRHARCKACMCAAARERYAALPEAVRRERARAQADAVARDPAKLAAERERKARWEREHRDRAVARREAYAARVAADPALRDARNARDRERTRMNAAIKAMRNGADMDYPDLPPESSRMAVLPSGPLAAAIMAEVRRRRVGSYVYVGTDDDGVVGAEVSRDEVCTDLGTSGRRLYAWEFGDSPRVTMSAADEILTRLGVFWWDVWNEDTTRVPVFTIEQRQMRTVHRVRKMVTLARTPVGDRGPDHDALAMVRWRFEDGRPRTRPDAKLKVIARTP